MALINNKFKLEKFKKFRCFSGDRDVDARAATSGAAEKRVPWGTSGGPRFSRNPGAQCSRVVVVLEAAKTPKRGSPDGERTEG